MTGSTWWGAALTVVAIAVCAFSVVRAAARPTDREAWGHALMGGGMAGMVSPWGDPVPPMAGVVVFTVLALGFGAARLAGSRTGIDAATHLAIGSAAMVLMYLTHGSATGGAGAADATGSAAHGAHSAGHSPHLLVVGTGVVLAGYFVWRAWEAVRVGSGPDAGGPDAGGPDAAQDAGPDTARAGRVAVRDRRVLRAEPVAHAAMSALMAAMLLGAV